MDHDTISAARLLKGRRRDPALQHDIPGQKLIRSSEYLPGHKPPKFALVGLREMAYPRMPLCILVTKMLRSANVPCLVAVLKLV